MQLVKIGRGTVPVNVGATQTRAATPIAILVFKPQNEKSFEKAHSENFLMPPQSRYFEVRLMMRIRTVRLQLFQKLSETLWAQYGCLQKCRTFDFAIAFGHGLTKLT
jgi:hypothetical protein